MADHLIATETSPPPGARLALGASALLASACLLGTGFVDAVWPAPAPKVIGSEGAELQAARRNRAFVDGSLARWAAKEYQTRSRVRRSVSPWWSAVMLELLHAPPGDVVRGEDGWLFLRARVEVPEGWEQVIDESVALFGSVTRRLSRAGTSLRFLPVPRKAAACPDMLPLDPIAEFDRQLIERMAGAGIPTVDTLAAWADLPSSSRFLPRDTHWALDAQIQLAIEVGRRFPDLMGGELERGVARRKTQAETGLLTYAGLPSGHPITRRLNTEVMERGFLVPEGLEQELADPSFRGDVVLTGTSFTASFSLHALLVGLTGRKIESRARKATSIGEPLALVLRAREEQALPSTILYELPVYQTFNYASGAATAVASVGEMLSALPRLSTTPIEGVELRVHPARSKRPRLIVPAGRIPSSHPGALALELDVESDAATRWRLRSGPLPVDLVVPSGGGRLVVPLAAAARDVSHVLLPRNPAARAAGLRARLVLDASPDDPLLVTSGVGPELDLGGGLQVAPHSLGVLRWTGNTAPAAVRFHGSTPDGEARVVELAVERRGAGVACAVLQPLAGGILDRVELLRARGPVELTITGR